MPTRITYSYSRGEHIIQLILDEEDLATINFAATPTLRISSQLNRLADLVLQIEQAKTLQEERTMIRELMNRADEDEEKDLEEDENVVDQTDEVDEADDELDDDDSDPDDDDFDDLDDDDDDED